MNKEEFKELQDEQGEILYGFERFNKKCHVIDLKYTVEFFKYLRQQGCLQVENTILATGVKIISEGQTKEQVAQFLEKSKESYSTSIVMLDRKHEYAKVVVEHKKNDKEEDIAEFEKYAKNYFRNHHPGISVNVSKEQNQVFNQLRTYYYDDNIAAFIELAEMYTSKVSPREFSEEEYTTAAQYYYKLRVDVNTEIKKQMGGYPFNCEHVFDDEMSIATEEANIRVRLKQFIEANKQLHKDFEKAYGEDVNFIEK